MSNFEEVFEELANSPEPWAVAPGGPRTEDLIFTEMLSKPEVDGGGIEPLPELQALIQPQFEAVVNGRDYHIATAFITREEYEREDAYVYTAVFSVYI